MSDRTRNIFATVFVVLGGIVALAAALVGYANHVAVDRDGFAERVTRSDHGGR